MSDQSLVKLFKHMAWANHSVFTILSELPEDALNLYTSNPDWKVGGIANHIVETQPRLLSRLKKEQAPSSVQFPITSEGMKELASLSLKNGEEFLKWIDQPEEMLTFGRYDKTVSFQNTTVIAQIIHHSTEHRAQIADILEVNKISAINLDSLDLWSYELAHRSN
jgi:uncharacterized damage-inducible protein DinB